MYLKDRRLARSTILLLRLYRALGSLLQQLWHCKLQSVNNTTLSLRAVLLLDVVLH